MPIRQSKGWTSERDPTANCRVSCKWSHVVQEVRFKVHDPKAHSKGGTLENTINGRADEETASAPQHIIHPGKDITKLYGMSRPCTHIYNTILPLAWQAIKQYSVLSLAGCLFQRASERGTINCTVLTVSELGRPLAWYHRRAKGLWQGRHNRAIWMYRALWTSWRSHAIFIVDDTTRLRPLYYIQYIFLYA